MTLSNGAEALLVIEGSWYQEMVRNGYFEDGFDQVGLDPSNATSAIIVVTILDTADSIGLWISSDSAVPSPMLGLQVCIPWRFVLSIATHPDFERVKKHIGFQKTKSQ
jgi:hypothetical protein